MLYELRGQSMRQTKENGYQELVDEFIEKFKDDFNDVVQEIGPERFKARLLEIAQKKMPEKEREILLAQEPALKIISSLTTTETNTAKAIHDYQRQLDQPIREIDNALESLEQKQNPSEMERREHVDLMFEMHMLMGLQEKVDLIAKNMSDPDIARVMANTQHDARKLVRDIRRNSMNLARQAAEAKDPAVIDKLSDQLTTIERKVDGMSVSKTQILSDKVRESEEKVKGNPNASEEEKIDHAFYQNNQNYFEYSMNQIRAILSEAKLSIQTAFNNATQSINRDSNSTNNSRQNSPDLKRKRSSLIDLLRRKKATTQRDSKVDSTATNPFNVIQGTEGRASFKVGEEWKEVKASQTQTTPAQGIKTDSTASTQQTAAKTKEPSYPFEELKDLVDQTKNHLISENTSDNEPPLVGPEFKEYASSVNYDFIEDDEDSPELKDADDPELNGIPEAAPKVDKKRATLVKREIPKSRPTSTVVQSKSDSSRSESVSSNSSPDKSLSSSPRNSSSFPTGKNPRPSSGLMEALMRAKIEAQAKKASTSSTKLGK